MIPGTIGLSRIVGTPGRLIHAGQLLCGEEPKYARWTHAFIYVGNVDGKGTDFDIIQANTAGAERVHVSQSINHGVLLFEPRLGDMTYEHTPTAYVDRMRSAAFAAIGYVGTPYSFADYLAIAAHRWKVCLLADGIDAYVAASKHMICSQLIDEVFIDVATPLIPLSVPGDVLPADLARLAYTTGNMVTWSQHTD